MTLQATIELVNTKRDKSSVFKVHSVNVKVDTLKFAIRDSNHDFLYKTLRPLATGLIKKQIEKYVFCDLLPLRRTILTLPTCSLGL